MITANQTVAQHFEPVFINEYFKCSMHCSESVVLCQVQSSYVPIEIFIETFSRISPIIKEHEIKKFIFDKRALRVFHQPTMEWYFVKWKEELYRSGLHTHRKILPNLSYFNKSVEAGRCSILLKYRDFDIEKFDIQYFDTIDDCVKY
jgi:hypothetical protein